MGWKFSNKCKELNLNSGIVKKCSSMKEEGQKGIASLRAMGKSGLKLLEKKFGGDWEHCITLVREANYKRRISKTFLNWALRGDRIARLW